MTCRDVTRVCFVADLTCLAESTSSTHGIRFESERRVDFGKVSPPDPLVEIVKTLMGTHLVKV
jgi:hypothetical protein